MHFLIFNISLSYLLWLDRNFKQQFLETIWRSAWEFCKVRDWLRCQDVWLGAEICIFSVLKLFYCNNFHFSLVWQYVLVSKGVYTY